MVTISLIFTAICMVPWAWGILAANCLSLSLLEVVSSNEGRVRLGGERRMATIPEQAVLL